MSEATWATIWDLPTPQAPQMCRGTRWPISACSASKSAEGFMEFPFEMGEGGGQDEPLRGAHAPFSKLAGQTPNGRRSLFALLK
jgi:hypothetical protein